MLRAETSPSSWAEKGACVNDVFVIQDFAYCFYCYGDGGKKKNQDSRLCSVSEKKKKKISYQFE